jgi:histone demethylase JARID1
MGAVARSILDYAERVEKFHYLNGRKADVFPKVEGKLVKLYELKCAVENFGSFKEITKQALWGQVAGKLGLSESPETATTIKHLYTSLLHPYEDYVAFASTQKPFSEEFKKNTSTTTTNTPAANEQKPEEEDDDEEEEFIQVATPPQEVPEPAKRGPGRPKGSKSKKRKVDKDEVVATPPRRKVGRPRKNSKVVESEEEEDEDDEVVRADDIDDDVQAGDDACEVCEHAIAAGSFYFVCNDCTRYYHCDCLDPKLSIITKENMSRFERWHCPYCLIGTCEFYFYEGEHQYTLKEFKDRADSFKEDYIRRHAPTVENAARDDVEDQMEREFWHHIECLNDCDLCVEYGADIHCDLKGSGFPTLTTSPFNKYSRHGWNLNNFPQLRRSLFHNMKQNISGVTVPWAYVGMMFSAFCWHSEDHYTYSVNYQHLGATKTWYGIPGSQAEKFEQVARATAPEIFEKQPNILFQRGTILSPEHIITNNVNCYVIDQRAGQFVITFPKAYHAGFNHGFNFNEAVNYAPPDWVPYGLESVKSYQQRGKEPIFSHDSLFILTAEKDEHPDTAEWLIKYLGEMIDQERYRRRLMRKKYPSIQQVYDRSDAPDEDYYQCDKCKYLAYLSRIIAVDEDGQEKRYCFKHMPESNVQRLEIRFKDDYLASLYFKVMARIPSEDTPQKQVSTGPSSALDLPKPQSVG